MTPCIEWTGGRFAGGYGYVQLGGRSLRAHRVEWERHYGPIPAGMVVCHRCDNPPCINVEHLFLGTMQDNMTDMVSKGRHWNSRKKQCLKGHAFSEENTYRTPAGNRVCKHCRDSRIRDFKARHKIERARQRAQRPPAPPKTHCMHGHPLAGENLHIGRKGQRICRTCRNGRVREWKAAHRVERQVKTHCVNGHLLAGENIKPRPNGYRTCRECARRQKNECMARKRDGRPVNV